MRSIRKFVADTITRLQPRFKHRRVEYLVNEDISNGREQIQVPAFSYRRDDKSPVDFHYVTEYIQSEQVGLDPSLAIMQSCGCTGDCADGKCSCSANNSGPTFYDSTGRLSSTYRIEAPEMIRECNAACDCNRKLCQNMVIQGGCRLRLALFRTKSRGWGVRTLEAIKCGTFVGVYCGELVPVKLSLHRQDDTYLFNLSITRSERKAQNNLEQEQQQQKHVQDQELSQDQDSDQVQEQMQYREQAQDKESNQGEDQDQEQEEQKQELEQEQAQHLDQETVQEQEQEQEQNQEQEQEQEQQQDQEQDLGFVCDARFYGNFTRFINHSCEPNVIGIRSLTEHQDNRFPYITFFANQDLPANSELTLHYGDSYWRVKCKRDKVYCLCKKSSCKFTRTSFGEGS